MYKAYSALNNQRWLICNETKVIASNCYGPILSQIGIFYHFVFLKLSNCIQGKTPPITSVLDMTLNNLMVRFLQCWSFRECGVTLHCHRSQVQPGPEW